MVASETVEDTRALVHRIRNDLQLASSILHAEVAAATSEEARRALAAMDRRLIALNLTYSGSSLDAVELAAYLRELCLALGHGLGSCAPRSVPANAARRLGMIVAEALGTAGAPSTVSVTARDDALYLEISREPGVGAASEPWLSGIAEELTRDLVEQLGATLMPASPTRIAVRLGSV